MKMEGVQQIPHRMVLFWRLANVPEALLVGLYAELLGHLFPELPKGLPLPHPLLLHLQRPEMPCLATNRVRNWDAGGSSQDCLLYLSLNMC